MSCLDHRFYRPHIYVITIKSGNDIIVLFLNNLSSFVVTLFSSDSLFSQKSETNTLLCKSTDNSRFNYM